ncbi:MAG: cyclopropane-fatty-acyl-phospholipid synthase family protein [Robiginitomaculum sp.]|nr:cyclopropane-fatty-acyl-phospholipid synthase family protein [Robiginitomaculum sp.]
MSIWARILDNILSSTLTMGALEIEYPHGLKKRYGRDMRNPVRAKIISAKWVRRIVLDPELALGEAYMRSGLRIKDGNIYDLLDLIWTNLQASKKQVGMIPDMSRRLLRRLAQFNPISRARKNVAHHYNIGNDFYALFLDDDLQYSCTYYTNRNDTLEQAQAAKCALIADKLLLKPHHSLLEIGCGWGGLGLSIAQETGAKVTGITLSQEQLNIAQQRMSALNLSAQVDFKLEDYRMSKGKYDRIVSVGMFEHVGVPHYQTYFDQVANLLNDDGVALIHTIGRPDSEGITNPWIAKYIFPGGYIPALSEILPHIERAGLIVTDVEVLRLHYADTLREWRRRFLVHVDDVAKQYGKEFARMWNFYLVASELSFRHNLHNVFQIQLAKRQDAVPLTRDYLLCSSALCPGNEPGNDLGNDLGGAALA